MFCYCSNAVIRFILGYSPCQLNNGGCSHLCLLSSNGSECTCPANLVLKEDGKNCQSGEHINVNETFLVYCFDCFLFSSYKLLVYVFQQVSKD